MVLRLRIPSPDWHDAKCLGLVQDWRDDAFFDDMPEAMMFCNGEVDGKICPIRQECLLFALTNNLKEGVWGGMSETGRKALRKKWPLKGNRPRPEWEWYPEKQALRLVSRRKLEEPDED